MTSVSPDQEINLGAVFQVIWDRGLKIIGFSAAVAVMVYLGTFLLDERYGARSQLILEPSKVGTRSLPREKLLHVETYTYFICGEPLLVRVLEKFPQLKEDPYNLKTFRDLSSRIHVDRVGETTIIEIYIELEDAQLAADVCNYLAKLAYETNLQLVEREIRDSARLFSSAFDERYGESEEQRKAYLTMQKEDHIDSFRTMIENKRTMMEGHRAEIDNLETSQIELASRLNALMKEQSEVERFIEVTRSLSEDNMLIEAVRTRHPEAQAAQMMGVTVTVQELDLTYAGLDSTIRTIRAQFTGDRAKLDHLVSGMEARRTEIRELEDKLFDMQMAQEVARTDWLRNFEITSGIDKEEGWVGATVGANRAVLQVLFEAVPNDKRASPQRTALAGVAGAMAFLLLLAYFIMRDLHHFVIERQPPVV